MVDGLMAMCGVRRRDMGRNGWAEIARSLNGVGTCLVVASLGLSVLWGFTSWSRLGIYAPANQPQPQASRAKTCLHKFRGR